MRIRQKLACTLVVAALALPFYANADGHEEPGDVSDVWIMVPKRGMEAEFVEAAKKHIAFRKEAGEEREWNAFRSVVGHHINHYQYRACCYDWADLDGFEAADEELGLAVDWNANVDQYVDHYHHYIELTDRENSHWPDDESTQGPYYGVTTLHWKENPGPGPGEAREKISTIAKENGWAESGKEWMWLERVGGKDVLMLVIPYEGFGAMEAPDPNFFEYLSEQLGSDEKAGALFDQMNAGFKDSDFTVWKHEPDLSTPDDE